MPFLSLKLLLIYLNQSCFDFQHIQIAQNVSLLQTVLLVRHQTNAPVVIHAVFRLAFIVAQLDVRHEICCQTIALTKLIELEGWSIEGGYGLTYNCGGIQILKGGVIYFGGNTILFQIFENLPPHYNLKVKVQIWRIDSWQEEVLVLYIDENQYSKVFHLGNGVKICGGNVGDEECKEEIVNFEVDTEHTSLNIRVQMKSTLDEDPSNESWGVRDFQLFVATCWRGCKSCSGPSQANCLKCQVVINLQTINANNRFGLLQVDPFLIMIKLLEDDQFKISRYLLYFENFEIQQYFGNIKIQYFNSIILMAILFIKMKLTNPFSVIKDFKSCLAISNPIFFIPKYL